MHHESNRKEEAIATSSDKSFGLVFAGVFTLVAVWPVLFGNEFRLWSACVAAVFLAAAFLFPCVLAPLNKIWTKIGLLLHHIVNPLVMSLVFFGMVTPMGLIMRILGKRPLSLSYDPSISYWIKREPPGPAPESFKNQF